MQARSRRRSRARANRLPVRTTLELANIVASAIPNAKRERQHPAKRTFQAIRIAVNDELAAVEAGVQAAVDLLAPGGRVLVITFHSLEDRIVKSAFRKLSNDCTCPPDFRCASAAQSLWCGLSPASRFFHQTRNWPKTRVLAAQSCGSRKKSDPCPQKRRRDPWITQKF